MAKAIEAVAKSDSVLKEGGLYLVDEYGCIYPAAEESEEEEVQTPLDPPPHVSVTTSTASSQYQVGDHIAKWCTLPGMSEQAYKHHGIILDLKLCRQEKKWTMTIADFSYWAQPGNSFGTLSSLMKRTEQQEASNDEGEDGLRTYEIPADDPAWFKVDYEYDPSSPGTARTRTGVETASIDSISTTAHSDDVHLVLQRVVFLLEHPEVMPKYDVLEANCETVAVWCKTGLWATLQVVSGVEEFAKQHQQAFFTAAGHAVKSRLHRGLWESAVPAPSSTGHATSGIVGLSPHWLAAYGLLAVATPKLLLWYTKRQWQDITQELNANFWESLGIVENDGDKEEAEEAVIVIPDEPAHGSTRQGL